MRKPEIRFTRIKHIDGDRTSDTFQVQLKVGHQTFDVGHEQSTRSEALWLRRQLVTALHNVVGEMAELKESYV